MKHIAWALLLLSACRGPEPTTTTTSATYVTNPGLVLSSHSSDGLVVTMTANAPFLSPVILDGHEHTAMTIKGYQLRARTGAPLLPEARRLIAVPAGHSVRVEILDEERDPPMTVTTPLAFAYRQERHDAHAVYTARDQNAYRQVWGEAAVSVVEESFFGHQRVAVLKFHPLRYDAVHGTLELRRQVRISVQFTADGAVDLAPMADTDLRLVASLVMNPDNADRPLVRIVRDLLIANEGYRDALKPLVDYKKAHGRDVTEVYYGRTTTTEVMQRIRDEYRTNAPQTTMLVGSIDQIPSWRTDGIWTDVNYANLDSGSIPDVALGRLPAQTPQEVSAFVAKAIGRAEARRNPDNFLLTAGSDTSMGCPANVDEIGAILRQNRATVSINKLYRANGASQQQIIAGYNSNPNVIVYDGHGDQSGMTEIPFLISHLPQLTNEVYPIILDIACLNANWPSTGANRRNFAETILLRPGRGAAGIVAAGGNSGGHEFFQAMATSMTESIRLMNEGNQALAVAEMGKVVLAAKVTAESSEDRDMFNYYGDPATSVF